MNDINAEMERVSAQIVQKRQLSAALEALVKQLEALKIRKDELALRFHKEKNDVDRLEGRSLHNLWLALTGKLEEQLDAEQREAMVAGIHLDAVEKQIEALTEQKESVLSELSGLSGCERQYDALIIQKEKHLRNTDPDKAERLRAFDEAALKLDTLMKEINEADRAGRAAKNQIGIIRTSLDSAENWGTWDLLGGGLISHAVKHSRLDDAQAGINHLQTLLDRFHAELTDVRVSREMTAQIDGFLRFADWFFDGLIADWAVLSRIRDSQQQLSRVEGDVVKVLDQLSRMREETRRKRAEVERERTALIVQN